MNGGFPTLPDRVEYEPYDPGHSIEPVWSQIREAARHLGTHNNISRLAWIASGRRVSGTTVAGIYDEIMDGVDIWLSEAVVDLTELALQYKISPGCMARIANEIFDALTTFVITHVRRYLASARSSGETLEAYLDRVRSRKRGCIRQLEKPGGAGRSSAHSSAG